jgi:hypothetical protein
VDEDAYKGIDVLDNDSDADGKADLDPASVTVVTEPGSGTATANDDGTVTYHRRERHGTTLTYRVCDEGGLCDEATWLSVSR